MTCFGVKSRPEAAFVPEGVRHRMHSFRKLCRGSLSVSAMTVLLAISGAKNAGAEVDLGPLMNEGRDIRGNRRIRMAGPFFEWQKSPGGKVFTAVRPLYNRVDDPSHDRSLTEVLWPVSMFKNYRDELFWRIVLGFGHDFDEQYYGDRYRFVLFPLVYAGISAEQKGYFGIFPLAGKVDEFLGRDTIRFLCFPLYMYTSVNDVGTHDVLWPVFSWTRGKGVLRYRAWPVFARSERENQWKKTSILWPIWNSVSYEYPGCGEDDGGFILFPLFGYAKESTKQTWWLVPPFFKYARNGSERRLNCPYPFIQYSSGEQDKLYLWPLWGRKSSDGVRSGFFLWPVGGWSSLERSDYTARDFRISPLLSYGSRTAGDADDSANAADGKDEVIERRFKLWPLMSYRRVRDESRFRMFDLWPAAPASSVEKNFAPIWTIYSRERLGALREDEFMWGLFRYRRDGDTTHCLSVFPVFSWREHGGNKQGFSWSILLGLFGYEREGLRKTIRLLYFPFSFGENVDVSQEEEVVEEDRQMPAEEE